MQSGLICSRIRLIAAYLRPLDTHVSCDRGRRITRPMRRVSSAAHNATRTTRRIMCRWWHVRFSVQITRLRYGTQWSTNAGSCFMPPPTDRCVGGMFSGCRSVSASMRLSGALVLLARCLTNQFTEYHLTLVDDVAEGTAELIRFWSSRVQGQGHIEVMYLSASDDLCPVDCRTEVLGSSSGDGLPLKKFWASARTNECDCHSVTTDNNCLKRFLTAYWWMAASPWKRSPVKWRTYRACLINRFNSKSTMLVLWTWSRSAFSFVQYGPGYEAVMLQRWLFCSAFARWRQCIK